MKQSVFALLALLMSGHINATSLDSTHVVGGPQEVLSANEKIQLMEKMDNERYCLYGDTLYGKGAVIVMAGIPKECKDASFYDASDELEWVKTE